MSEQYIKEARHYEKLPEQKVKCVLCPRECVVADLERGTCGVRENRGGVYYTLVHSRPCSLNADPIEKKPLFHYLPGSGSFSLATAGCNMECLFCQNWEISQFRPEQVPAQHITPEQIVTLAIARGCKSIACTYSEPVVFYEYMYDIGKEARARGVGSVMISNGYILEKPMRELLEHLNGVKIDLKSIRDGFYRELCRGKVQPVLDTLKVIKSENKWLEIVVLLIPTHNDSLEDIGDLCSWVMDNLGPDVPVHFTRFHPTYRLKDVPSTPPSTLQKARETGLSKGLHYVYAGNVPGNPGESTYCPKCKTLLIERKGFFVASNALVGGKCPKCSESIPGVWA